MSNVNLRNNNIIGKSLKDWRDDQESVLVNVDEISINHPSHIQTKKLIFPNGIVHSVEGNKVSPIIISKTSKNTYNLLFGLKQLIIAKLTNCKEMYAIIVDISKERLINYLVNSTEAEHIPIENIIISDGFLATTPSKIKVKRKRKDIDEGHVPLIELDKSNVLTDGYITYLILKEMGHTRVWIERRKEK